MTASDHLSGQQFSYHFSPRFNRESIEEHGLRPRQNVSKGQHVWLLGDEEAAHNLAQTETSHLEHDDPTPYDVYKVDVTGMKKGRDPHEPYDIPGFESSHVVNESIPPHRLQRQNNDSL